MFEEEASDKKEILGLAQNDHRPYVHRSVVNSEGQQAWSTGANTDVLKGEVRSVSSTGGEKGVKIYRYDLIPTIGLKETARQYGMGSLKYQDRQWERGFLSFSKS